MIAFEIYLNGKKTCTAGVGELGVLGAHITWVRRKGEHTLSKATDAVEEELTMDVGGLISPTGDHVRWGSKSQPVQVGDEIRIRIIEVESVDEPSERYTF